MMPGWTAEIEVDADLDKIPDGPVEAAKYAVNQVRRLAEPCVTVFRHNDDDTIDSWMVDTLNGQVTYIGQSHSGPTPEERIEVQEYAASSEVEIPIMPGCLVERIDMDLDPREVVSIGRDWLTLDILGEETERLPMDNYRAVVPADGRL